MGTVTKDALRKRLVDLASQGQTTSYGKLLETLGIHFNRGSLACLSKVLGTIARENIERFEPCLAVLVVNKAQGVPGKGFYELMRELDRFTGNADTDEAREYAEMETRRCFQFWKEKLLWVVETLSGFSARG